MTYHGRILDATDKPVEAQHVLFKIQVRSPGAANCLLYEETRSVDMRGSDGIFVIPIGDGVGQRSSADPGILLENVFSNNPALDHLSLSCNTDGHYQPQTQDSRKLIVTFNDGSGSGEQVLPPMDVNYVPFALSASEALKALKIGTIDASKVMSVASGAATPLSAGNFAELLMLVNGNSTAYLKPASVPTCASGEVLKGTAGAFVCVTDAAGTDTLAGISCADGKILKRVAGSWACADESGVGTESDPTVQAFAKVAPGTGLTVSSGAIVADFGTAAGKVAQGNDSRFTDARAPNGAATGDLSGSYPNPTVKGIRGNAVNASAPADAQVYKWVTGSSEFQPKYVGLSDLRKSDGSPQIPQCNANANETLIYTSVSDTFTCTAINNLDASKITTGTLAYARLPIGVVANTIAAGDDARFTNSRAPNGTAGGELGGTYPNPTIAKLAGVALNVSALSSGQVLKYDGTSWVNAPDSGVGSEIDPSVQQYAKSAPGTGLKVISNLIVPDFGTGAGKVVEGNDSRLSDNRVASDLNSVVSTGLVQRTGPGAFSTLGVSAPITNSGTNIGLAVGSGLTLNTGALVPDFGTTSGKVAQGNDSRFPSSTCASGSFMRWSGSAWVCETDNTADASKVAKGGDTMTGTLNLPSNGLVLGTTQLVASGSNVGIGTASPASKLEVAGMIHSTSGGIKFPDGSIQTTASTGGGGGSSILWDVSQGSFAIHSGAHGDGPSPSSAFDDNATTRWSSSHTGASVNGNAYIGQDFGAGVTRDITQVSILHGYSGSGTYYAITSIKVQYSDNGSSWTDVYTWSVTADYSAGVQMSPPFTSAGTHRYWRLLANSASGGGYWNVHEIQFMQLIGGGSTASEWSDSSGNVYRTSGNVGIGTASPGQKLTVAGTIESTTGGIKFPDGTTQTTAAAAVSCTTRYNSCAAIKAANGSSTSGLYTIDPDGASGNGPFVVYCDMSTDGGGWTLVSTATDGNYFSSQTEIDSYDASNPSPTSNKYSIVAKTDAIAGGGNGTTRKYLYVDRRSNGDRWVEVSQTNSLFAASPTGYSLVAYSHQPGALLSGFAVSSNGNSWYDGNVGNWQFAVGQRSAYGASGYVGGSYTDGATYADSVSTGYAFYVKPAANSSYSDCAMGSADTYRVACGESGSGALQLCCQIAVSSGNVVCKYASNPSSAWQSFTYQPFTATTSGNYSVKCATGSTYNSVCRTDNTTGATTCMQNTSLSGTWTAYTNPSPF